METISTEKLLWESVGVIDMTISKRESHPENNPCSPPTHTHRLWTDTDSEPWPHGRETGSRVQEKSRARGSSAFALSHAIKEILDLSQPFRDMFIHLWNGNHLCFHYWITAQTIFMEESVALWLSSLSCVNSCVGRCPCCSVWFVHLGFLSATAWPTQSHST